MSEENSIENCMLSDDGLSVVCCGCGKINSIQGNTKNTMGTEYSKAGGCKLFWYCPEDDCNYVCCLERGGPNQELTPTKTRKPKRNRP
ncbi:hypothetical protein QRT07_06305 [Vibrio parahaemolyticus]|uniref:hypothetical protein n=1 Tax=Vibrio parahaemolyticus TaxID=670 RepID=UPI0011217B40|nr:hypothetical protein [Vibrio parahaemolyticus]WJE05012.1 hypothetical protein QRT07_06305 [Vibrio parahaemolyticus]